MIKGFGCNTIHLNVEIRLNNWAIKFLEHILCILSLNNRKVIVNRN